MTESIVLKVGMAQRQSEAGYGRARIDTESRRALGLDIGDTNEIICQYHLRRTLSLEDGDHIDVKVNI